MESLLLLTASTEMLVWADLGKLLGHSYIVAQLNVLLELQIK